MKVSTATLRQTKKLTNATLPLLDDDEWILIRGMRNALGDINAQIKASSNKADQPETSSGMAHGTKLMSADEDPDVQELENKFAQEASTELVVDEGLRWSYVADYMILDFKLYDIDQESGTRGRKLSPLNPQDREDVFALHGQGVVAELLAMGGGQPVPVVKAPDGTDATFQGSDAVGNSGPTSEAQNAGN